MARKKNSTFKYLLFCFFILLILVGLFWGTKAENYTGNSSLTDDASSLQEVNIPDDVPSQIINYEGFTVSFNSKARQPNYVAWELTPEESVSQVADRKDYDFQPDTDIDNCAELQDYKNSGYSRGHMAPAADMKWSQEAMRDCHYLTNICPQKSELNNGAWKSVEDKCRQWVKRDSALTIICGPILSDKIINTIGMSRVAVPERFFKVIIAPYANPPRAIGFIMNNGYVTGGMQQAAVSVDEIEAITGFDFFSSLPDDIEDKIEAECNFPIWSKKH